MSETLPKGWIEIDLDKIVIYSKGKKPKTLNQKNDVGLVPYVNIKAFEKGIIDEYADVKSSKLINKTDILVVWDGARFGLTGMGMEGAAGSTLMVLIPILNKPEYIYNFINRHYSYINSKPKGTGTPHVNPDIFWKLQFPIAPLNEQKRIVAKLDQIMPRIVAVKERLDKVPAIVKRFRQSVLTAAVTGKLTEKWREKHPDVVSAEVLQNITTIQKYEVPSNWAFVKLNALIKKIQAGKNFSCPEIPVTTETIGLVKISAVTWDKFDPMETKTVDDKSKINKDLFINEGDFLISRANTIELVGASVIVDKIAFRIMISDKVWRVEFSGTNKRFVNYYLKSSKGRNEIESRSSGNQQSMRNISQKAFRDIDTPFPPLEEQKEIVRQVDKLFALSDRLESHYQKAKARVDKLSQSVLAKAFRGELVITEAELAEKEGRDFESAEKLLERILAEKSTADCRLPTKKKAC